jgi:hypothetical protein
MALLSPPPQAYDSETLLCSQVYVACLSVTGVERVTGDFHVKCDDTDEEAGSKFHVS